MTTVVTNANQSLTTVGAFADPQLVFSLSAGVLYLISAQIEWSEASVTDGGFQVGLSYSGPTSTFSWTAFPDPTATAYGTGSTVNYTGQSGNVLITLSGSITPNVAGTLSVIRGLANASANPTTLLAGSLLRIELSSVSPSPSPVPTPADSSGTYDYSITNAEAILAAYERVQIRAPSIRQGHMLTARRELNGLFAEWSNRQVNLWSVELFSTDLVEGQAAYSVLPKTILILDAYVSLNAGTSNQTDTYVTPMSRTQYASIGNKDTEGRPTSYWFDRLISPTITMWPVPDASTTYTLNYYACVQLQDANTPSGETPNIPYRWFDVLVAGLAKRFARVYAPQLAPILKAEYDEAWTIAAEQDTEYVNFSISPSLRSYYRR